VCRISAVIFRHAVRGLVGAKGQSPEAIDDAEAIGGFEGVCKECYHWI